VVGVLGAHLSDRWAAEVADVLATLPQAHAQAEVLVLSGTGLVVVGPENLHDQRLHLGSVTLARQGQSGSLVETWPDGRTYLVGYHQGTGYRDFRGLGWVLLIREPAHSAFAPIAAAERQIVGGHLALGLLLTALAWFLAHTIARPIRALAATSDQIRRGQQPADLPLVTGEDEVARLAASLHSLIAGLHDKEQALSAANIELQQAIDQYAMAEARRSASEEQLRLLVEGVRDYAIIMLDPQGVIVSWNRGAEQITGYGVEEALGQHVSILYLDLDEAARTLAITAAGGHYLVESQRVRKGGEAFWAHVTVTALRDADGQLRGFAKVTQDISARVAAESQLRESEARLAGIVDSAMDAVITVDAEQRIVLFNRAAEQMFGYTAAEASGQPLDRLIPASARAAHRRHVAAFGRTGVTTRSMQSIHPLLGLRRDQTTFPIEASISRITVSGQTLLTAIVRDITERTRLERQFLQAQKMEMVGRLAGGVAHDFNNLLSVINGYSEFLLEAHPDPADQARQDIEAIRQAGEQAAGLTRQLLAFSRRQPLQPHVLDLNEVLTEMEKLLRRLIGQHIAVELRLAPDVWPVRVDRGQLEQVVMNLAVNARDAMPDGGTLTFTTTNQGADTGAPPSIDVVRLEVADTGVGMGPETLAHLFEPFFTTKAAGQGTGLGFATVHGIVTQSGGTIAVWSAPGQGARFTIDLPRHASDELPDAPSPEVEQLPVGAGTILLVEDEAPLRALAARALGGQGYRVLEAADASAALEQHAAAGSIDLLLTDIVLPGMSGDALANELRRRQPGLRVLLMSGYPDRGLEGGRDVHGPGPLLMKPLTPALLAAAVRAALQLPHPPEHDDQPPGGLAAQARLADAG
jgi:PAS domain S-box-containing protein